MLCVLIASLNVCVFSSVDFPVRVDTLRSISMGLFQKFCYAARSRFALKSLGVLTLIDVRAHSLSKLSLDHRRAGHQLQNRAATLLVIWTTPPSAHFLKTSNLCAGTRCLKWVWGWNPTSVFGTRRLTEKGDSSAHVCWKPEARFWPWSNFNSNRFLKKTISVHQSVC